MTAANTSPPPAARAERGPARLTVSVGQHSHKGRKPINQDFHGACLPQEPLLSAKGVAVALADGIGSSEVSHIASEMAVRAFLEDYYCTSQAWSVKTSARRVLMATNSWLHAQTMRNPRCFDADRGYVCTLSAMVIKSATAHLFHVGDSRIYRLHGHALEQLTEDHRLWLSRGESYLSRALGANALVEIDYQSLALEEGDTFVLVTDGVYEHVPPALMAEFLHRHADDLDAAAQALVAEAAARGSADDLTAQIVRVDRLPSADVDDLRRRLPELPFPPELEARSVLDGYEIVRKLHTSPRSHVYLAVDRETGERVALKTPASELREDAMRLERFLMEEWIARRLSSPHVVKAQPRRRPQSGLYVVTEFIEGRTLSQWMIDHPRPDLETARDIVEQIGKGLRAFHRQEMVHQDLRPDNVLIDRTGTARIIDFGAVRVAGIAEVGAGDDGFPLGTVQYAAPECLLGESASERSDIFSLGVITYQMLTGRLPYGTQAAKVRTTTDRRRLKYARALPHNRDLPPWLDGVLRKAVHPDPGKRYEDICEFLHDLRHPPREFLNATRPPLIERDPVRFWQGVSMILAIALAISLFAGRL